MGRGDPVFCLQRGDPQNYLHDKCGGIPEPGAVQNAQNQGRIPTQRSATKLILLAIRNFEKGGRTVREWVAARNQLAMMFEGRFDA